MIKVNHHRKHKWKDIKKIKVKMLKPFVKKYGHPVLVHALNDSHSFMSILKSGEIRLPKNHNNKKKSPYMEKLLNTDNSIFFSIGFLYWAQYGYNYNFIFDWGILKDSKYYYRPLALRCYTKIVNWLYENDRKYFNKIGLLSEKCQKTIDHFIYCKEDPQSTPLFFKFWETEEKILFNFIMKHPRKVLFLKFIKKIERKTIRSYPYSKRLIKNKWDKDIFPEINYYKDIDLMSSPYFLGFFIDGKISKVAKKILREKYKGKIIFDGKKIRVIK